MSDDADAFYGSDESLQGMYADSLRETTDRIRDTTGMTEAEGKAHLLEVARFARDAGIPPSEIGSMHSLLAQHTQAPADDATVQKWAMESLRMLREKYGEDGRGRLADVKTFMDSSHPRLMKRLNSTGIGSHPKLVLELAERAGHLKARKSSR